VGVIYQLRAWGLAVLVCAGAAYIWQSTAAGPAGPQAASPRPAAESAFYRERPEDSYLERCRAGLDDLWQRSVVGPDSAFWECVQSLADSGSRARPETSGPVPAQELVD
jgi:hypothetical protein